MSAAGKRAIVTGAGSGIGAALCRALDLAGAHVLCTDIDLHRRRAHCGIAEFAGAARRASTSPTPPRCRRPSTTWSTARDDWT